MDRHGYRRGYRRAKMPKRGFPDEDSYDMQGNRKRWPSGAWLGEDYFGYAFDAGVHRICECPPRPVLSDEYT